MKKSLRGGVRGVWIVGLLGALEGCSTCAGEAFTIRDGVTRFPVPGAPSKVVVLVPDITSFGASAQALSHTRQRHDSIGVVVLRGLTKHPLREASPPA
ncbi:MAG: hypothetical protein U0326_20220 [Polyangiales bacterium]